MIDYELEHQVEDFKRLKDLWTQFREFYRMGQNQQKHSAEEEQEFLECKKRIALLHERFMDVLPEGKDRNSRRMQAQGKAILDHVVRCVTIKHIATFYDNDHKTFETDWNNAYLLLNDTIANLEERRDVLANMSYTRVAMTEFIGNSVDKTKKLLGSSSFRNVAIIAVVIGAPIILHSSGLYTVERLYRDIPQVRPIFQKLNPALNLNGRFNLPYFTIEELPRRQSARPQALRLAEDFDSMNFQEIINELSGWIPEEELNLRANLSGQLLDQKNEVYISDEGDAEIYIILTRTIDAAEAFERQYRNWLNTSDEARQFQQNHAVIRSRNMLVFVESPSEEIQNYFVTQEFNFR